ncbi:MAG: universal stress protein [Xanthomonadales bacterium]|nr:universal stress protein [Xanthomonadales bacterium]
MQPVYLVGVDGSPCAERALEYALARAQSNQGRILAVFVIEWSPFSFSTAEENERRHARREQEMARAQEQVIAPVLARLEAAGVDAEGLVRHGNVAQTLDRLARKHDVTCLVIGRRGSTRLSQLFGSVASHVVQLVDRPVTVVP